MRALVTVLALAACYRSAPPPPVERAAARPSPSPCMLVAVLHDDVQTIEHPQTIHAPGGDTTHAGEGDRIITGPGRLAVLDVDVATGATTARADIATGGLPVHLLAAAARGREIALHVIEGDTGNLRLARIDLRARKLELADVLPFEWMRLRGVLASDGASYYKPCGHDRICRADDWEVRGNPITLATTDGFEAIASAYGELFAIRDGGVHVFELATGTAARTFPIAGGKLQGLGVAGDDLVVASGGRLARYDRGTGEPRGIVPIANLDAATDLRLACR